MNFTTKKLGFEKLESRELNAAILSGDVLAITGGTEGNENVEIRQNDAKNRLEVWENGQRTGSFKSSAVREIHADLKGGNDTLDYRLAADFLFGKDLHVELGSGDDKFNLYGNYKIKDDLLIVLAGQNGSDILWANIGSVINADVTINANMGEDVATDRVRIDPNGELKGDANVNIDVDLGNGDDAMTVYAAKNSTKVNKDASLKVTMDGGNGTDTLGFYYKGKNDGSIELTAEGGNGYDYARFQYDPVSGSRGARVIRDASFHGIQEFLPIT